jgi:hypothetical protein
VKSSDATQPGAIRAHSSFFEGDPHRRSLRYS